MATVESENRARYRQLLEAAQSRQSVWIAESKDGALLLTDEAEDTLILVLQGADISRIKRKVRNRLPK